MESQKIVEIVSSMEEKINNNIIVPSGEQINKMTLDEKVTMGLQLLVQILARFPKNSNLINPEVSKEPRPKRSSSRPESTTTTTTTTSKSKPVRKSTPKSIITDRFKKCVTIVKDKPELDLRKIIDEFGLSSANKEDSDIIEVIDNVIKNPSKSSAEKIIDNRIKAIFTNAKKKVADLALIEKFTKKMTEDSVIDLEEDDEDDYEHE